MPRIRTIKPDYYDDEKLARISIQANFLYQGMWVFADDEGVIKRSASWIKSKIFPHREELRLSDVKNWIKELEEISRLIPFDYNGESYYLIIKMKEHQRIDKPQPSKIPDNLLVTIRSNYSKNIPRTFQEDSSLYSIVEESIVKDSIVREYRAFAHLKISYDEFDNLISQGYSKEEIDNILDAIQNYKKNKNYTSLYLTAKKWLEKEKKVAPKKEKGKIQTLAEQHDQLIKEHEHRDSQGTIGFFSDPV